MEFILSGEIYVDTGIAELNLKYLSFFDEYFKEKNYSDGLDRIFVVLVCRPFGPFKQRKRYDPVKKVFMADIMFDFNTIMTSTQQMKEVLYFRSFRQIYPLLEKYKTKIKGLKLDEFKNDLEKFLEQFI